MLDTEKTREQLEAALAAARCHISELESILHDKIDSQNSNCSSHYEALVRLYELEINSLQDLFDFALEEAIGLTKSSVGYICFYEETTKVFTLYSWSKNVLADCTVAEKPNHFCLENTGIWGEVVRQRRGIVINDFSYQNPHKKGTPEGHISIHNFLSIPVWMANKIIAVVAVGNKCNDYTEFDVMQLDLFTKGVWVIAQRKQAEEALRISEERYRSVVQDQTEIICRFTPDGTFLFVNEVYCRFFGKPANELIGSKWTPAAVSEDIPTIKNLLHTLSPEYPVVSIEHRVYNAQDTIRWMQFINRAIFDNNLNIIEIQSVGRDITDRKLAEEALLESKLRWKFALEGSGDGVWDWNIEKNTLFFSQRYKSMIGYEEHEISDNPSEWKSRVHPDDLEDCLNDLHRYLNDEIPAYEREYRLLCKDNSYKWMLSRGKVIQRNREGKPLRAIGTITDITERKHIEILKEEVDKIMRHDLRSSLIGIIGLPDILLENKALSPSEREILITIQESGYKILSMVDNSISIYKMELGTYKLNPAKENIIPMIHRAITGLDRQFKNKDINFFVLVDGYHTTNKDIYLVDCENTFCFNMISNLLLNALEVSPPKETIYLRLSTSPKSLSITNKGSVPCEIRKNFFNKYVTAGKKNGTGLGTYSAALIAKTHAWKIRLDTSVPNETTVSVVF